MKNAYSTPEDKSTAKELGITVKELQAQRKAEDVLVNELTHDKTEKLQAALYRLECGLSKKSTPQCEYYEGIEFDALDELKALQPRHRAQRRSQ